MKHCGTQIIETSRLILRPFVTEDASAMYHNWASDPEVTKYLTWPPHANAELTEMLLKMWVADYAKPDHYQWAIELRELGEVIGSISVVKQNEQTRMAQVGYCIGRHWGHQGIMTEALQAVIDYLFTQEKVECVSARCFAPNEASLALLKSLGFHQDGYIPRCVKGYGDQIFDDTLHSLFQNTPL